LEKRWRNSSRPCAIYVSPQRFAHYQQLAHDVGLQWVKAGPFVRSSYHAIDALQPMTV
jgi:lipoate synthase